MRPEDGLERIAQGTQREALRVGFPRIQQILAEIEEAELQQSSQKLQKGELTPEGALTILQMVRACRLLEQKVASWIRAED